MIGLKLVLRGQLKDMQKSERQPIRNGWGFFFRENKFILPADFGLQ